MISQKLIRKAIGELGIKESKMLSALFRQLKIVVKPSVDKSWLI